jgi:AAA domain
MTERERLPKIEQDDDGWRQSAHDYHRERIEGEAHRKRRSKRANGGEQSPPRFKLIPFDEIVMQTAPAYLIKGLVPRVGLTVIWGPPKCGKSFWALDLAMHPAIGRSYRGRRVRQGPVVYIALEGQFSFPDRVEAFRQRYLAGHQGSVLFYLLPCKLDLIRDHRELIKCIREQTGDATPVAVFIDTLNRSLKGSESKDEDMSAYVQAADRICDEFECAVPIIHHCGINAERPRGHTSLTGTADAQLAVKRDAASNVVVTVEWMKDGPEGETIVSRLELAEIGINDDGDVKSSCVVVPLEGVERRPITKPVRLSPAAKIGLRALADAIADCGEAPPASNHIPQGVVKATTETVWRQYAYRRGISTGEERAKQQAFKRASEQLRAAQLVGTWDEYVWQA